MKQPWILFIDDDSNLVGAAADLIDAACREIGAKLWICTSTHELPSMYAQLQYVEVRLAVLDLWLIDKTTNVPDHEGGLKVLKELRERWPQSYVLILSAHLDEEARARLEAYENIAIVEKPVPIWEIRDLILDISAQMTAIA